MGKRAKTDPLDAGVIADFAEATKPAVRALPDADTRRLADLVARRGQIVDMIVAERETEALLASVPGRAKTAALVAVARKLLTILNAIARDRPTWQEVTHARPSI